MMMDDAHHNHDELYDDDGACLELSLLLYFITWSDVVPEPQTAWEQPHFLEEGEESNRLAAVVVGSSDPLLSDTTDMVDLDVSEDNSCGNAVQGGYEDLGLWHCSFLWSRHILARCCGFCH